LSNFVHNGSQPIFSATPKEQAMDKRLETNARTRAAALTLGAMALAYLSLSIMYFWLDWFQFLHADSPMHIDPAGVAIPVNACVSTILGPWRVPLAMLAVVLLGVSGIGLWRGRAHARALSLVTLWGVLLPQVLWYTEFVVDWYQGQVLTVVLSGLFAVMIPSALLFEGRSTLGAWGVGAGRPRLFLATVALGWIGFLSTNLLDHSYQVESTTAYVGALLAIPLAAAAMIGILRLRSWALWAAVASASSLAIVPFALSDATYFHSGGYIDSFVQSTTSTTSAALFAAMIPVALVWLCIAPFLHAFIRKCLKAS
jgi:hypothetical protein